MKRILVIGPGGAGKSTFANRLAEVLGLEVIHLDSMYWQPGWVEPPKSEWAATIDAISKREQWIMDGNYLGTLESRLAACEGVVFLDLPRRICLWRVLQRAVRYRHRTRPDMAPGCHERLNLGFLLWIWSYPARTRPEVLRLLGEHGLGRSVIRLRSQIQVEQYLERARVL